MQTENETVSFNHVEFHILTTLVFVPNILSPFLVRFAFFLLIEGLDARTTTSSNVLMIYVLFSRD